MNRFAAAASERRPWRSAKAAQKSDRAEFTTAEFNAPEFKASKGGFFRVSRTSDNVSYVRFLVKNTPE
ncbi:MAG TPA: hypothetical protein VFE24_10470 [Pirellulales bacterium]|jgi:hypothetical protein|nr:hypothetical protein [Pirellulales bacterium]